MIKISDRASTVLTGEDLIAYASVVARQGFAPPPEIYQVEYRKRIDWSKFPDWARPVDPEIYDGCCHEG